MRDTQHLKLIEHGAYTLLLDHIYTTEKPLKNDRRLINRICHADTVNERAAIAHVLKLFFKKTKYGYVHKRVQEEISRAKLRVSTSRDNGKRGGRPPKSVNPAGLFEKPTGFQSANLDESSPDSRLQTKHKPPLPPACGGHESHDKLLTTKEYGLMRWGGGVIIVRMGRHRRVLTKNDISAYAGASAERMVEVLNGKGFWAEIYKPSDK